MNAWDTAERGILAAHAAGDHAQCTSLAVRFAAPWMKAHLRKSIPEPALVEDAFAEWSELVATSWDKFDPKYSVSTWLYVLARRPRRRALQSRAERAQRESALDSAVVAPSSSAGTAPYLRTTVKQEFRALWSKLDATDREILRLRIEEGLGWEDVAHRLRGPDWQPTGDELKREMQNLAARYKRKVKDALAGEARARGLLQKYGVDP